ncbi:low molecular weight phosphatase family protein [Enemella evansiae]|uniref:protein-tyrosine-phosphatase n=1 Tax=Enemella evansiae TaxID=2016499 RepID=A0A255GA46_9ACTN|nr:low molecular weight protein-tyrosine-phosphatase [Enemella evansiae]OYO12725.1 low molecular weight phosphatase family protein [Enemella evansiae]
MSSDPIRVDFVCWGNICRSPMAERVAEAYAEREGLTDVEFSSSGVSSEELGNPMDPRAAQWLRENGYRADDHTAHQVTREEIDGADLVVAMEDLHVDRMRRLRPEHPEKLRLLTDFDPDAEPGSGVPDPWYGDADGFGDTLASIEAAMPGVFAEIARIRAE